MKIFVTKSINLILIIGIVYVYCTQAGKLQKNMADAVIKELYELGEKAYEIGVVTAGGEGVESTAVCGV